MINKLIRRKDMVQYNTGISLYAEQKKILTTFYRGRRYRKKYADCPRKTVGKPWPSANQSMSRVAGGKDWALGGI